MNISRFSLVVGLFMVLPSFGMMVIRDHSSFVVNDHGTVKRVHSHDVDKSLYKMNTHQYNSFLKAGGRVIASRLSNGDYAIHYRGVKGEAGGPILGFLAGCAVRAVCYGGAAAGITALATAAGAPAVVATAAAELGTYGLAGAGAATAQAAIEGAGLAQAAGTVVASVAGTCQIPAAIAAVETAATTVSVLVTAATAWCPI